MPPHWVRNLTDYWRWLERLEAGQPCSHENGIGLIVQLEIDAEDDSITYLRVPRQRLVFYDGSSLSLLFDVNDQLEQERWSFHYAFDDPRRLIFRMELGPTGGGSGMVPHIHLAHAPDVHLPYREVDLCEVFEAITKYRDDGQLPSLI